MNDTSQLLARFLVSGRVQGVFYRASTREQALKLGLRGYAKNLADGRVEVLVVGEAAKIAELERWLWRGPERAAVNQVQKLESPAGDLPATNGFLTL